MTFDVAGNIVGGIGEDARTAAAAAAVVGLAMAGNIDCTSWGIGGMGKVMLGASG